MLEAPPENCAAAAAQRRARKERSAPCCEGYLAAQYEAGRRGWPDQELLVWTAPPSPISTAPTRSHRAGAELVVGPLTPAALLDWQPPGRRPPLLTLAWHPRLRASPSRTSKRRRWRRLHPCSSALAAEDEASQLAQLGYNSVRAHPADTPEGSWGIRMGRCACREAWREAEEGSCTRSRRYTRPERLFQQLSRRRST